MVDSSSLKIRLIFGFALQYCVRHEMGGLGRRRRCLTLTTPPLVAPGGRGTPGSSDISEKWPEWSVLTLYLSETNSQGSIVFPQFAHQ